MKGITYAVAACSFVLAANLAAQDSTMIVMGQYLRCNVGQESRADEITRTVMAPIVQKHVDSGQLSSWSWLSHVQGGAWRRILVLRGTDLDAMMDATDQMVQEIQQSHRKEASEFGNICSSHDDYIWGVIASSPAPVDASQAPASISTYYVCDGAKEGRADAIFERLLVPIYKKHTDAGDIAGWAYLAHREGGPVRRLETFSGADHKKLLHAQAAIYQEAFEADPLAFNEFREVCNSHSDYMWMDATPR